MLCRLEHPTTSTRGRATRRWGPHLGSSNTCMKHQCLTMGDTPEGIWGRPQDKCRGPPTLSQVPGGRPPARYDRGALGLPSPFGDPGRGCAGEQSPCPEQMAGDGRPCKLLHLTQQHFTPG